MPSRYTSEDEGINKIHKGLCRYPRRLQAMVRLGVPRRLRMVRQAVERYGRPLASSVDNRRIYPWVTHQSYRTTMTTAEAGARVQCQRPLRCLAIGILRLLLDTWRRLGY